MIVHLARQDPGWWRVESLRVFAGSVLQTIPTKWWSAPPWQIVSSQQERTVFGADCGVVCETLFVFLVAA